MFLIYVFLMSNLILSQYHLSFGEFDSEEQTLAIILENEESIGGFQFQLTGLELSNAYGGIAEEVGFTVNTSDIGVVLGFSFAGEVIPAGNNILTYLNFNTINNQYTEFTNVALSSPEGVTIQSTTYEGLIDHGESDCSGSWEHTSELDECGVCDGPGAIYQCGCLNIEEGMCDCEGNQIDECGICGGDNSSCYYFLSLGDFDVEAQTLDIMISNPGTIAGFQFEIPSLVLNGASGGIASSAGFTVQTGPTVVLGFSFSGSVIEPSQNELLTTLSFSDIIEEITTIEAIILTDENAGSIDNVFTNSEINHGLPNCAGEYYAANDTNEYGCCFDEVPDCLGICDGGAVFDSCGECGGDGYSCLDCFDLDENICGDSPFCNWETDSINCSSLGNSSQCNSIDGCTWVSGGGSGGGGTYGGNGEDNDNEYRGYCTGGDVEVDAFCAEIACSDLNESECSLDNSCSWYSSESELECINLPQEVCDEVNECNWISGSGSGYGDGSYCSGGSIFIEHNTCGDSVVLGCMMDIATNYNPEANTDDGSCIFPPLGVLSFGHVDLWVGTLEVNLDCEYPVQEFTVDISGLNITGCYGGASEDAGFDITLDGNTFTGTSNGEYIPEHSGLLFVLTFDSLMQEDVCFDSSSIVTSANIEYEAILDDCMHIDMGCTDMYGLNYDSEAIYDDGSCEYADYRIESGMFYFSPDSLNIDVGESIQWDNIEGYHSVNGETSILNGESFGNPEDFYLPATGEGLIGSKVFEYPGIYYYDCDVGNHAEQGMVGYLVVGQGGCIENTACNFLEEYDFQYGVCEYPETNFDCNGDCIVEIDSCGICAGDGQNGDVNIDGNVNVLDVTYLVEYILLNGNPDIVQENPLFDDLQECIADVNNSGSINVSDVVLITHTILDF